MDIGSSVLVVLWNELKDRWVWSTSQLGGRSELAALLGGRKPDGAKRDDAELIDAALLLWGRKAPARFSGPFVFASADPLRRQLLLGRDHVGQFPLYYARIPGGVVVSMDLEAVLAHPQVDDEVDMEAAALLYARAVLPLLRRTPFGTVAKVAPGTTLALGAITQDEDRYWDPASIPLQERGTVSDWAEQLRAVLELAVADALPGCEAVGAHLSGGLNSAAVAVLADRALYRDGRALSALYSWSPPVPAGGSLRLPDERRLVEAVAAAERWDVTYVADDPELTASLGAEDPLVRPLQGWLREAWVARHAAAHGVRVLLSGWGGDEAASFDGCNLVSWLAGRGQLLAAYRELRDRASVLGRRLEPARVAGQLALPLTPSLPRRAWRRAVPRRAPITELDIRHRVWGQHSSTVADAVHEFAARLDAARTPHDYQVALLTSGHLAARCESWSAAGGRLGVDYRYPLLDRRLVELALSAPAACFRSRGWDRFCFRLAVEPFVPGEVAWNPHQVEPALTALALDSLTVAAGRGMHPRNVELAELESLQREADLLSFALVRGTTAGRAKPRAGHHLAADRRAGA